MSTVKPISKLFVAALLLCAAAASADVMNGDFENGGDQWQVNVPTNWQASFPAADGNPGGHASIQSPFGGPGGLGLIMQTFMCGDPNMIGTCTITYNWSEDVTPPSFTSCPGTKNLGCTTTRPDECRAATGMNL